jgi:hypothetical protein
VGESGPSPDRGDASPEHRDWIDWHRHYDDPGSVMSRRLGIVSRVLADAITHAPAGSVRILSLCSGDGRDLATLTGHPRKSDVHATLVELNPQLAERATQTLRDGGIGADVLNADAGLTDNYSGRAPYDIALVCGVFGNISPEDIRRTIAALAQLVRIDGTAIWTRHRRAPDLTPIVRGWFRDSGFVEIEFLPVADSFSAVGVARLDRADSGTPLPPRLFSFVGDGADALR